MISSSTQRTIWQRLACCVLTVLGCAAFVAVNAPVARAEPLPGFTEVSGSPFMLPDTTRAPAALALGFTADGLWLVAATDVRLYLFAVSPGGNLTPRASWAPEAPNGIDRLAIDPAHNVVGVLLSGASPTLTTLAITSSGGLVPINSVTIPDAGGASIAFNPDGSLLAVGIIDEHLDRPLDSIVLFAVEPDGDVNPDPVGQAPVVAPTSLAFDPAGRFLAVADADGDGDDTLTIFAISVAGVPTLASSALTGADPFSVMISADGFVATANLLDHSVSEFALDTAGQLTEVASSPYPVAEPPRAVAYTPSGRLLAVGDRAGGLQLLTVGTSGQLNPAPGGTYAGDGAVRALAIGAAGGLLADLNGNGYIHMFAVAPPTATPDSPQGPGAFTVGAAVVTHFSCADSLYAPGIASCFDSNASKGPSGFLDTGTVGKHTYSVTATSRDGQSSTSTIEYAVTRIPTRISAGPLDLGRGSARAKLTNANTGQPLGGKTLRFSVSGKTVCKAITDGSGYATCKFPLTGVLGALFAGRFEVSFLGDTTYAPSATSSASI